MAETGGSKSSASQHPRKADEETLKDQDSKIPTNSPKKKKVRRHRLPKGDNLGRVEEETDDETERRSLSSRERKQLSAEEIEGIPTLNYVSDDKKPPPDVMPDDPEEEDQTDKEPPDEEEGVDGKDALMTEEEKQAMYRAATLGDIDILEDCLDKPNSDINMVWFQENLLIAALKAEQEEMAEFLIDNGVNYNLETTVVNVKDEKSKNIEWYTCNCRQLAFDRKMLDIVELIDYLNGDLFRFIKPKARVPRYRRPKPPTPEPATGGESENDASSEASENKSEDEGDGRSKRKKKKKRKDSKEEDGEKGKDGEKKKEEKKDRKNKEKGLKLKLDDNCDADSGHHSSESVADVDEFGNKITDSEDGSRSRTSSNKTRTSSSPCSTRITSSTGSSSLPFVPRSETFIKRFMFLTCPSDEGYGSLSSKSSPTSMEAKQRKPKVTITIQPRGTKSSLGMRQASLHRKAVVEQDERPLTQKKVKLPGSYVTESSRWYGKSVGHANRNDESLNIPSLNVTKIDMLRRQDAHYMRMTASAYTKRKLEPNFRKGYSSLDFVSDKICKSSQVSGSPKKLYSRHNVNNSHTNTKNRKETVSVNFRSSSSVSWRTPSLPSSGTPKYYRMMTRVC